MAMLGILRLSLDDFFTQAFLKFSLLPLAFSVFVFLILGFFGFNYLIDFFNDFFSASDVSALAWLYSLAVVQIIVAILSFLSTFLAVVFGSVFLSLVITGFLTPFIVSSINQKYYHYEPKKSVSFIKSLVCMLFAFLKFIFFLLCAFILWFFPFVNLFVFFLVFYYLFHQILMIDVASSVLDKEKFKDFAHKFSPLEFKFATLCFYLLSCVPLLGVFLQVFFVIFLSHLFYQKILKLSPNLNA